MRLQMERRMAINLLGLCKYSDMKELRRDIEYISVYVDERIRIVEFIFYARESDF